MMKAGRFLVFAHDLAHGLQPRLSFCGQAERVTAAIAFIWRAFNQTFDSISSSRPTKRRAWVRTALASVC
jgi:hypothetical protein